MSLDDAADEAQGPVGFGESEQLVDPRHDDTLDLFGVCMNPTTSCAVQYHMVERNVVIVGVDLLRRP